MSALAKLQSRGESINGDLHDAIDTLGELSEQYNAIAEQYEIAKKRVSELANAVQDTFPLSLEGKSYRVNYSACSVTAKLDVPVESLFEAVGLSGFSPNVTACRKLLAEEGFKLAFRDEFGSRKLKSVTKYR